MADLVTRILLENKQFNEKIVGARKTLQGFEADAKKAGGGVGGLEGKMGGLVSGGLTKLVGGFGAAATAGVAFKKIIEGSQITSDLFDNAIGAAKTSVDQFFSSISTGDFSNFVNGLGDVYERAKKAQEALDQLWNTQNAFDLGKSSEMRNIAEARTDALDTDLDPEKRKQALKQWGEGIKELDSYTKTLQDDLEDAVKKVTSTYSTIKPESFALDDVVQTILIDVKGANRKELKKKAKAEYSEYVKAVKQAEKDATKTTYEYTGVKNAYGHQSKSRVTRVDQSEFQPALDKLNEQYKSSILVHSLLVKMKDSKLQEVTKWAQEYDNVGGQIADLNKALNKAEDRVEKQIEKQLNPDKGKGSGKSGGRVSVEVIIPDGSIAEIDKKLSEARKLFSNAVTDEARAAADKLIKELESKKVILEVSFKGAGDKVENSPTPLTTSGKTKDFSDVNMRAHWYKPKEIEHFSDKIRDAADRNRDLIDTFYGLGDAVGNFSGLLGEESGAWLQWGANLLTTVGQAIPALTALAGAKAANSVAQIPIVGPLLAVGAIASIIGAFANLPKFEYGGVVGGSSYSGDKLLARVNSGEMILNKMQQGTVSRVFNALDGGGGSFRGEITLRARGRDLIGVMNAETLKASRR